MEENIEVLLKQWQMPDDVVVAFRTLLRFEKVGDIELIVTPQIIVLNLSDNNITIKDLADLTPDYLKELCPQIGHRIKLKKQVQEYLESKAPTVSITQSIDTDSMPASIDEHDISISFTNLLPSYFSQSFLDFDLKTLLETSPTGKSVLNYYASYGHLDTKRKNRLTDIIIRHLFTFIVNSRLTYDDYNILTGKIITLFPKETAGTYFARPIKKKHSSTGKSIAAKGKLVDKVRNFLFQSSDKKRVLDSETQLNEVTKKQKNNEILLSAHEEDIEWLNSNNEPWLEVKDKWKKTLQIRQELEYENVNDFLTKWKVLQLPTGAELIEEDFKDLYPEKVDLFNNYWKAFMQKLIELKKEEINLEENRKKLLNSLDSLDPEDALPTELTLLAKVPPKGGV